MMAEVAENECRNRLYSRVSSHSGVAIVYPSRSHEISNQAKIIINKLLQPNPVKRMRCEELLSSEWLQLNF